MAERGAGRAAADRGRPPATQPERERMIDALKAAFVQDRLTKDEFDERVGLVLVSRTHAELAALTADIPAGPVVVRPPRRPLHAGGGDVRPVRPHRRVSSHVGLVHGPARHAETVAALLMRGLRAAGGDTGARRPAVVGSEPGDGA